MESLKDRVERLAAERGMSLGDVARGANMDRSNLNTIFRARPGSPTLKTVMRLADALDVPVIELVVGVDGLNDWVGDSPEDWFIQNLLPQRLTEDEIVELTNRAAEGDVAGAMRLLVRAGLADDPDGPPELRLAEPPADERADDPSGDQADDQ